MRICWAGIVAITLLVAGCGKPDASGIYVVKSDNEATLIQLVQTPDDKITGRVQSATIGSDGFVANNSGNADGSVSGNELVLRPTSFWFGGLQASGTFTGSTLTLTWQGGTATAERSTLQDFDKALAHLQSVAADRRAAVAGARFKLNQQLAKAQAERETADRALQISQAERETADRASQISNAAARLDEFTASLNEALARSPDFGKLASDNTARIARMVQTAPSLSDVQRGQLSVAANQVEVGTNQIEVARSQYAIRLNGIVDDARAATNPVAKFCPAQVSATLAEPCARAKSAATRFATTFQQGTASFKPQKQRVQIEIYRQNKLIAQIDG